MKRQIKAIAKSLTYSMTDSGAKAYLKEIKKSAKGKNLSFVIWKFIAAELRALPTTTVKVQSVIDPVIAGMDLLANGKDWPKADARRAASAAYVVRTGQNSLAADAVSNSLAADAASDAALAAFNVGNAACMAAYAAWVANDVRTSKAHKRAAHDPSISAITYAFYKNDARFRQSERLLKLVKSSPEKKEQ